MENLQKQSEEKSVSAVPVSTNIIREPDYSNKVYYIIGDSTMIASNVTLKNETSIPKTSLSSNVYYLNAGNLSAKCPADSTFLGTKVMQSISSGSGYPGPASSVKLKKGIRKFIPIDPYYFKLGHGSAKSTFSSAKINQRSGTCETKHYGSTATACEVASKNRIQNPTKLEFIDHHYVKVGRPFVKHPANLMYLSAKVEQQSDTIKGSSTVTASNVTLKERSRPIKFQPMKPYPYMVKLTSPSAKYPLSLTFSCAEINRQSGTSEMLCHSISIEREKLELKNVAKIWDSKQVFNMPSESLFPQCIAGFTFRNLGLILEYPSVKKEDNSFDRCFGSEIKI